MKMPDIPEPGDEDIDALAGDYVLGTLSAPRRAAVAARLEHEPALRDAVAAWEARLLPLVALAPPAEPSPEVWRRIEGSLGGPASTPAPQRPQRPQRPKTPGWWNSLGLWRAMTGAGFATSAVLAVVLALRAASPPAAEYLVVLVEPQNRAPGYVVQTTATRQLSLVPLGTAAVPARKSLQFWTKADRWKGPVSLGLVKPGQTLRLPLDQLPALEPDQLFELTLEPENGSPIDRPTGPIQYIGRAVKVL
jgi:anti-sigma-K factor RskA